jgi:hypothetical protein
MELIGARLVKVAGRHPELERLAKPMAGEVVADLTARIEARVRAEVAEEIAQRLEAEALKHRRTAWDSLRQGAKFAREHGAPEHVTPRETP